MEHLGALEGTQRAGDTLLWSRCTGSLRGAHLPVFHSAVVYILRRREGLVLVPEQENFMHWHVCSIRCFSNSDAPTLNMPARKYLPGPRR